MSQTQLFDCDICGQEAMTEPNLRTHMLLEHEENAGCCPLCDLQDVGLDELNLHVNTAHAGVLSPQRVTSDDVTGTPEQKASSEQVEQPLMGSLEKGSQLQNGNSTANPERITTQSGSEPHEVFQSDKTAGDASRFHLISNERKRTLNEETQTNKSTAEPRSPVHSKSLICACSFNLGKSQEPNGSRFSQASKDCDIHTSGQSGGASSSTTDLQDVSEDNLSSSSGPEAPGVVDRKRTRSDKSEIMPFSSAVDVDCSSDVSSRTSASSASSTASPLKKFFRFFSPRKTEKSVGNKGFEQLEVGVESTSASQVNGIWSQGENGDVHSDPECPFCDASGLTTDDMARHVGREHADVLASPGPSGTPTQNRHVWNTSMIQKPTSPKTPKPTLLSLSKEAYNLQSVITCPICGLGSYDPDFLTVHFNTEHPTPDDGNDKQTWPTQPEDQLDTSNNRNTTHLESNDASCPVCGLSGLDVASLNKHVDRHFEVHDQDSFSGDRQLAKQLAEEEKQLEERRQREAFKQLQAKYGMDESSSYKQQSEQDLETAVVRGQITVADYNQQRASLRQSLAVGVDDGKSRTSGLIHKMLVYYTEQKIPGLNYVRLCRETDHFSSTYGDKGWGCGYRNLQIMLSSLVHDAEYRRVLFSGRDAIPSISKLQQLIETAWVNGFDPQGREQLGSRVVNTRKWIGATEIVTLLSYLRARCNLIDFHTPTGPGGTHTLLFEWVRDYFGIPATTALRHRFLGGSGIKAETVMTKKAPLYLQHEGHSRTIVGCEVHKDNSIRLLLFDPGYKVNDMRGLGMADLDSYAMRPIRKSLSQMKAKQYQIVSVDGLMTSDNEYQRSKIIRSERKP